MLIGLASLIAKPPKRCLSSAHCLDFNIGGIFYVKASGTEEVTVTKKSNKTDIYQLISGLTIPTGRQDAIHLGQFTSVVQDLNSGLPRKQPQPANIAHFVPVEAVNKYEKKS